MINARNLCSCLLTCTIPLIGFSPVLSQTPPTSPEPTKNLRTVKQVLNEVCSFLEKQKSFSVEMDVTYDDVLESGQKVQYSAYQTVSVNKPNQLRSDYTGDQRNTSLYYDGKTFTWYATDLNFYARKPALPSIDEVIAQLDDKYGINIPMSNLYVSNTCAEVNEDIQDSKFIGVDMVNRVPGYHLLFTGEERDFQLWVTKDPQPLLMKVVITYKQLPGQPQYTAVLSEWNFKPSFAPDTFTFSPPEDAYEIEILPATNQ